MAKNLQAKLPPSDSVKLFDINSDAVKRLAEEMRTSQTGGAAVELAHDVNDAAKESVCVYYSLHSLNFNFRSHDDSVLSMI